MILVTLILFLTAAIFVIKWLQEKNRHWEKLNVKHCKPMLLFGHSFEVILGKMNAAEQIEAEYFSFPSEDIIGHYDFTRPMFIVRNPDIIKKILITDFTYFTDRIPINPEDKSPIALNLFTMTGNTWRAMSYFTLALDYMPVHTRQETNRKKMENQKQLSQTDTVIIDKESGVPLSLYKIPMASSGTLAYLTRLRASQLVDTVPKEKVPPSKSDTTIPGPLGTLESTRFALDGTDGSLDQFNDSLELNMAPQTKQMMLMRMDISYFRRLPNTKYKLSPLFTSGKLKFMFGPMAECGNDLVQLLNTNVGKEVDMKEINSLFAMDVIGSCAFGIDAGAMRDSSSTFCKMGKQMFDLSIGRMILVVFSAFFPKLGAWLGISFMKKSVSDYFMNVILNTIDGREKTGKHRNDFVQLLLQLKEKGSVPMPSPEAGDEYLKMDKADDIQELEVTNNLLSGSAFIFLFAGFHTTSATLTYAFHELAHHPSIQERARKEIQEESIPHGGITYEALKSMNYLDNILKETMRLHPAVPILFRNCTKEYTFPNGLKIVPGEGVLFSVTGLHKDPAYFPDPELFNPDRFEVEPKAGTYLPFGEGPRICIAMRFAMLEMKFALAKILSTYTISPNENTQTSIRMEPRSFLMTPKGKVRFNINKLQS